MNKRAYKSNSPRSRILQIMALAYGLLTVSILTTRAEDFGRTSQVDLFVPGYYLNGNGFDATAAGLGIYGNVTDRIGLGLEGAVGGADVDHEDGLFYSALVAVEYNVLKSRFTPFISASGGLVGFETHTGDWFLGRTAETTRGAFGGGVGLRWNVTDHFLIKVSYRAFEITGGRNGGLAHMFGIGLGGAF